MPTKKKYAVFILTHKRPDTQITVRSLKKSGYTGKIYFVCDVDDPTLGRYRELYGENVLTFSKKSYLGKFDLMTNVVKFNAVVYARNAVYDLAKGLGLDFVVVMDDDYSVFNFSIGIAGHYQRSKVYDMDRLIRMHLRFLVEADLDTVAFAQGGDFVGGWGSNVVKSRFRPLRKAMNVFFFRVDRPVEFNGLINEDSVMGVQLAAAGRRVLTNTLIQIEQTATQQAAGGLTDIYRDSGTYQKSFYTLLASPSSTKVMYLRSVGRVHHVIDGDAAYPKFISEKHKR